MEAIAGNPSVSRRRVGAAVTALCLVQFVDVLGVTVVLTSLPAMLRGVHASAEAGSLVAAGYAACFGGLLMLGARVGDRFGHRRVIVCGLGLLAVAAVLAGTASSVTMLTAARCVQGAAAAVSVPAALRLLTTVTAQGRQRDRAIAAWSATGAAAGASGFVVGGLLTELLSWRAVFWAYLPIAAALTVAVTRAVPPDGAANRSVHVNVLASASFTAAVMALIVGTTLVPEPGHAAIGIGLLVAAVALSVTFLASDRRSSAPLMPARLFRQRPLRLGAAGAFVNTFTTSSAMTLTSLYLQDTRGHSPLLTAAMLLPFSLAVVLGATVAAALLRLLRHQRVIAAGMGLIAGSDAALVPLAGTPAVPVVVAIGGAGIGLSSVATTGLGTAVAVADRGTASGVVNTAAQLGTAVGIAVLLLIAAATSGTPAPQTPAPAVAWATASAVSGLAALAYVRISGRR